MPTLQEVSQKGLLIAFSNLHQETELIQDIQEKLGEIGFINLTKVSLGHLDPETSEALAMFQEVAQRSVLDAIDRAFAQQLLDVTKNDAWPITPAQNSLAGLTQVAVHEVRNKWQRNDINPEIQFSPMSTDPSADPGLKRYPEPIGGRRQTFLEPERLGFPGSEFLAWARH